ncbi:diphosphomevalonate decarboxylase [Neobacillus mesonae]|uniref:diphosphomevalonate decarboxylase n=1 Tax=Neobacillus mesonae TaxID=1193713 RepID=UPI00203AEE58|nr:diphosphomevalonate decarboxylase [Neobacillus mesonae]MCM3571218.1 diphosphomevalonate decarboxylase [Neobacillus mesonae]
MLDQRSSNIITVKAHTNIALIKYWGKRNESLFLPMNSSLSLTLDQFYTMTTVQFCKGLNEDVFIFNKAIAGEAETKKVSKFLNRIRKMAGSELHAIVKSINKVPTAAGFASSASGYAALAAAAAKAIGLDVNQTVLSQIARQGSGSASRSIFGGFVEWKKGLKDDGSDCYSLQIAGEQYWDIRILSVLLTTEEKLVSSREGMKRTVETSPFYQEWVLEAEKDLQEAKTAIKERNFERLGRVAEANALKMHATTLGANPPFLYWQPGTLAVVNQVQRLRNTGIPAYFTIDAGPNVKVLCLPENEQVIKEKLLSVPGVRDILVCHPGPGVTYTSDSI